MNFWKVLNTATNQSYNEISTPFLRILFWTQTLSQVTFGACDLFWAEKTTHCMVFSPLNSVSLAITCGHLAAGTNYLRMSSEVVVQRSRRSRLYHACWFKYRQFHHVHHLKALKTCVFGDFPWPNAKNKCSSKATMIFLHTCACIGCGMEIQISKKIGGTPKMLPSLKLT